MDRGETKNLWLMVTGASTRAVSPGPRALKMGRADGGTCHCTCGTINSEIVRLNCQAKLLLFEIKAPGNKQPGASSYPDRNDY